MSRTPAKEEVEAFKANIIVNIHQLSKIITTVLEEINKEEYNTIDQLECKLAQIVKKIHEHLHSLKKLLHIILLLIILS